MSGSYTDQRSLTWFPCGLVVDWNKPPSAITCQSKRANFAHRAGRRVWTTPEWRLVVTCTDQKCKYPVSHGHATIKHISAVQKRWSYLKRLGVRTDKYA